MERVDLWRSVASLLIVGAEVLSGCTSRPANEEIIGRGSLRLHNYTEGTIIRVSDNNFLATTSFTYRPTFIERVISVMREGGCKISGISSLDQDRWMVAVDNGESCLPELK